MSTVELVVVVTAVVSVLSLILNFIMYGFISSMRVQTTQMHVGLGSMLGKIMGIEQTLVKLSNGFSEFIDVTGDLLDRMNGASGSNGLAYRTADGKYTAHTLEELIAKIKSDSADGEYFTDDDITKLRHMFEEDDDDDDSDEE